MTKEKPKVQSILETLFLGAIEKLTSGDSGRLLSDIYVQLDLSTGEIQVYDDQEVLLMKNIIFDWAEKGSMENRKTPNNNYSRQLNTLKNILSAQSFKKAFCNDVFILPFNIIYTDENFNKIENIFTIEDDNKIEDGRLMKGLEQTLHLFYKKIFEDVV
jgi:hypothetical protein